MQLRLVFTLFSNLDSNKCRSNRTQNDLSGLSKCLIFDDNRFYFKS